MEATAKGVVSFRLSEEQTAALRAAAAEEGLSLSDILRSIIDEFIECYLLIREREEKIEPKP